MIDYRDSTMPLDKNSTVTTYGEYYATTYTSTVEFNKDEKAEAAKAEAEAKRVKKMRDLWKLERRHNRRM